MSKEETIVEFNIRVLDIANESDALEEKMFEVKLVRKVLRSIPPRFNMKITEIDKANDMSAMKLDELLELLRTFILHLREGDVKRKSGIALTSMKEEAVTMMKESTYEESLT
ncbi:Receptor-like protein 12 [Cucumis melo var. makuwa]|uniref:Receptor-like protein 12 n=1 Tax=Cucumis melo var. makuwa TaxID=1194695 RepID=A0A5D3BRI4_CUCMM|nr:Receptor-like protein 12 [Cucumis melo var. makuwa]TYK02273.1 Receptor-like protein 12 [Cucumis melo var. makuwa]